MKEKKKFHSEELTSGEMLEVPLLWNPRTREFFLYFSVFYSCSSQLTLTQFLLFELVLSSQSITQHQFAALSDFSPLQLPISNLSSFSHYLL